jgi:uncharacterized protein (DUF427 family)
MSDNLPTQNQAAKRAELVRTEPARRRIRVLFGGQVVADSQDAILLWEGRRPPLYYFPLSDVRMEFLQKSRKSSDHPLVGEAQYWDMNAGGRNAENAAWTFPEPRAGAPDVRGYITFTWRLMDAWFEEDDEVFVHPKDPYVRVDTVHSSRRLKVVLNGQVVAETDRPVLLFETGLITRYYIPKMDVRLDLLEPSDTRTACPYKGEASYYSVRVDDQVFNDLIWYYPHPYPEVGMIQNLLSFYNETVDLYLDGELQERPKTPFA